MPVSRFGWSFLWGARRYVSNNSNKRRNSFPKMPLNPHYVIFDLWPSTVWPPKSQESAVSTTVIVLDGNFNWKIGRHTTSNDNNIFQLRRLIWRSARSNRVCIDFAIFPLRNFPDWPAKGSIAIVLYVTHNGLADILSPVFGKTLNFSSVFWLDAKGLSRGFSRTNWRTNKRKFMVPQEIDVWIDNIFDNYLGIKDDFTNDLMESC